MSREQAALSLGSIALVRNSLDNAKYWFTIASADSEQLGKASAGLGDVYKFQDEFALAEPYFQKVAELCPEDPYCRQDVAEFWHDRAEHSEDKETKDSNLELARTHYVAAWKLNDRMPETYYKFGETHSMAGNYTKALDAYQNAESLLPSDLNIQINLAETYLQLGMTTEAKRTAESVLAWSRHRGGGLVERATEILRQVSETVESGQE